MSYYIYDSVGKSKSEAQDQALAALQVDANQVEIESEGGGLMGMIKGKPGEVRVYPTDSTPREAHIRGVLLTLATKLGVEAEIEQIGERDGNTYVEISSPDSGFIIGKHGRTLDALQFLLNLIVNQNTQSSQRIMVDVEQYRERREKSLQKLAKRMADRVERSGRPILLNYMNPYERRIVHLALESDERVFTESDGNGVYKRVRVIPMSKKGGGGNERSGRRGGKGRRGNRKDPDAQPDLDPEVQPPAFEEYEETEYNDEDDSRFNRAPEDDAEEENFNR